MVLTNVSKRLIKAPKPYFCDPGLACWLLGLRRREHIAAHPLRGAIFENWVITELLKAQVHRGLAPSLHFLRDKEGHEVDALIENGPVLHAVEAKSGATVPEDAFRGLTFWQKQLPGRDLTPWLVYGGETPQPRSAATVLPWQGLEPLLTALSA